MKDYWVKSRSTLTALETTRKRVKYRESEVHDGRIDRAAWRTPRKALCEWDSSSAHHSRPRVGIGHKGLIRSKNSRNCSYESGTTILKFFPHISNNGRRERLGWAS
jgi:hypothetical protein